VVEDALTDKELKHQKQQGIIRKLTIIFVTGLVIYSFVDNYISRKDQQAELMQSIIDENFKPTTLKAHNIHVPIYRLLPMTDFLTHIGVFPGTWEGYFGVYSQDSKGYHKLPGNCSDRTFDFKGRQVGTSRITGEITADTVESIQECNL
jgi:hypothetical protein